MSRNDSTKSGTKQLVTHDQETTDSTEVYVQYEDQPLTIGYIEGVIADYEKRIHRMAQYSEDADLSAQYAEGKAYAYRDALRMVTGSDGDDCGCDDGSAY